MLLLHRELLGNDNATFLVLALATVVALIFGIGFHEASHAFAGLGLGDKTAQRQHRTTLNPLAHLEPFGTLLLFTIGFGWGKPTPFNPYGLRVPPKRAALLIAAAGPASNFVFAAIAAIPIRFGWVPYVNPLGGLAGAEGTDVYLGLFFTTIVYLNAIVGLFNLIPIEPLDGFKVVVGLLPDDLAEQFSHLAPYGPGILLLLLFGIPFISGYLTGTVYNPLGDFMGPTVRGIVHVLTGAG